MRCRQLRHLAQWFAACPSDDDAHALFQAVFGLGAPRHVAAAHEDPEAIASRLSWWDAEPVELSRTLVRNGKAAVTFNIYKQQDANIVVAGAAAKAALDELRKTLPADMELKLIYASSDWVKDSLKGLQRTLIEGALPASSLPDADRNGDLGGMHYDIDFRNGKTPMFYRARLENGVIDVAKARSEGLVR